MLEDLSTVEAVAIEKPLHLGEVFCLEIPITISRDRHFS
jgi:hypothetical protein